VLKDIPTVFHGLSLGQLALHVAYLTKKRKLGEQGRLARHRWKYNALLKEVDVLMLSIARRWSSIEPKPEIELASYCRLALEARLLEFLRPSGRPIKRPGLLGPTIVTSSSKVISHVTSNRINRNFYEAVQKKKRTTTIETDAAAIDAVLFEYVYPFTKRPISKSLRRKKVELYKKLKKKYGG
jgi:hypothetical protein